MTNSATLHVMNNTQSENLTKPDHITSYAAMFDQLHKFFQNWIVLRMLGIRDCAHVCLFIYFLSEETSNNLKQRPV